MKNAQQLAVRFGAPWQSVKDYHTFEQEHMGLLTYDRFRIYCNKAISVKLNLTLEVLDHLKLLREIRTFDGCFNVRKIRGRDDDPFAYSIHSFGLALDFNAEENPLGGKSTWSPQFVAVWKALGWDWGGDFDRADPMHFEMTEGLF